MYFQTRSETIRQLAEALGGADEGEEEKVTKDECRLLESILPSFTGGQAEVSIRDAADRPQVVRGVITDVWYRLNEDFFHLELDRNAIMDITLPDKPFRDGDGVVGVGGVINRMKKLPGGVLMLRIYDARSNPSVVLYPKGHATNIDFKNLSTQ